MAKAVFYVFVDACGFGVHRIRIITFLTIRHLPQAFPFIEPKLLAQIKNLQTVILIILSLRSSDIWVAKVALGLSKQRTILNLPYHRQILNTGRRIAQNAFDLFVI